MNTKNKNKKSKNKGSNVKHYDPKTIRLYKNFKKLDEYLIKYSSDRKKYNEFTKIVSKYKKIKAGAHTKESTIEASGLCKKIIDIGDNILIDKLFNNLMSVGKKYNSELESLISICIKRKSFQLPRFKKFCDGLKSSKSPDTKKLKIILKIDDLISGDNENNINDFIELTEKLEVEPAGKYKKLMSKKFKREEYENPYNRALVLSSYIVGLTASSVDQTGVKMDDSTSISPIDCNDNDDIEQSMKKMEGPKGENLIDQWMKEAPLYIGEDEWDNIKTNKNEWSQYLGAYWTAKHHPQCFDFGPVLVAVYDISMAIASPIIMWNSRA